MRLRVECQRPHSRPAGVSRGGISSPLTGISVSEAFVIDGGSDGTDAAPEQLPPRPVGTAMSDADAMAYADALIATDVGAVDADGFTTVNRVVGGDDAGIAK